MGLLLLPFTLAIGLFSLVFVLPFMILRAALRLVTAILVLPIVLVIACVLAGSRSAWRSRFAVLAPLAPFAIVALRRLPAHATLSGCHRTPRLMMRCSTAS